ncbi:dTDP-4-dehydrorhamnose 3,5-epimerase [Thioclava sp. F34-6]|uniref:dTDP-4-dehydrorhamnose 3,5-epimerase n=1 Tax=Thioclava sp. F34-6 TaxID=1973003 RepID=UPI000B5437C5|nr:dTDP-4-dehydrorhamnose 3,5-epimerase [Thioclava sp. F34-6]OWY08442.1 dTDP-4-dehydrorhamnose 3,5-epimerase [Thioclava sp. F34-6]
MLVEQTPLAGVFVLIPKRFGDARGFFCETFSARSFAQNQLHFDFVQDNHSLSQAVGTVRGLHFQAPPHAQDKLVRCGRGRLWDVAVDIRKGSPTYGQWFGTELSFENGRQLLIPAGFAHGFITREPSTEIIYKCTEYYAPQSEGVLRWNDPDVAIDWALGEGAEPALSQKDFEAGRFADLDSPFIWDGAA